MKTTLVLSALLVSFGACGITQAAQFMDAQALGAAATGERFTSGPDTYRMLPGTVVLDPLPAEFADGAASPAARSRATPVAARPTGKVAARIGPYAVVLDTPAGAARSGSRSASGTERPLAAAVNERNRRVVLVRPQLKVNATTSTNAIALARNSGGTIVYTSTVDNSAVIAYPSVEKAQQALARLQANSGGAQLSLVVAQSIMQPM